MVRVRIQRVIQRNYVKEGPEIGIDHFMAFPFSPFYSVKVMHTLVCICMCFFRLGFSMMKPG